MHWVLKRLRRGERCWPAEAGLRLGGLGLLYASLLSWRWDCCLAAAEPPHDGTPLEFLVAALAFACLSAGLALLIEGPGLFRIMPAPPRALLP